MTHQNISAGNYFEKFRKLFLGSRVGESARLPPMCPGFDSGARRHMWVEFVVGSLLCSERFFSGYSGFPLSSKPTFPNSNSISECTATFERVLWAPWCCVGKQITFTFTYRATLKLIPLEIHLSRGPSSLHHSST